MLWYLNSFTGWRIRHAPARQMLKNREGPWQTYRQRDGQMRGLKDKRIDSQLPLSKKLYLLGKRRDNTSLRQWTALPTLPWMYSLCVLENYHLISLQMEYSCLLLLTSFADTPAHTHSTHTHRFIRLLSLYLSPPFLLMLIAEAGTAECVKCFLYKRVFIRTFTSNKCPIFIYAQPQL